ncbi:MAG TPA: DUF3991 domain-containing protein [Acidisoma sp.]|jgi:hypothetical protein|nr:DUF3991 domain-containing protein [Acidisoma sp.]
MTAPGAELDQFKTAIDLREYAAAAGYALDRRESWRGSAVMRRGKSDKIIVKRMPNGHYVYFSVHHDQDNGTIIDFVQFRQPGLGLGQVRKQLRPWIGRTEAIPLYPELERTAAKDRRAVEAAYQRMDVALAHPYLVRERRLPPALLASERFAGRIRIDERNNAIFGHEDEQGLCGFEKKNRHFTGFPEGGTKGLWASHDFPADCRLVFAEAAINALSYAALFSDPEARYRSIGGRPNPEQPGLIRAAILRMPPAAEIIAAMDNDKVGLELAAMVGQAVTLTGRTDLAFRMHVPEPEGADWNDIQKARHLSFPIAQA